MLINKEKKALRGILIFIISTILLYLGFSINMWKAADKTWFDEFQKDSEGLVIGKIYSSDELGILHNSGLLGQWNAEKQIYLDIDGQVGAYKSQIGLQGIVFSIINKYDGLSTNISIEFFRHIVSLFTAIILAVIILWIYLEFGFISSIATLILICFSGWITVFGRNLYWVLGSMFLPFALSAILLKFEQIKKKNIEWILYLAMFLVILLKCTIGYEFISTILISMEIPVIYYALVDKWNLKKFIRRFITLGIFSIMGFVIAVIIHSIQLSFVYGNIHDGFKSILYNVAKRTSPINGIEVEQIYQASLNQSLISVIITYIFGGYIINFGGIGGFDGGIALDIGGIQPNIVENAIIELNNFMGITFAEGIIIIMLTSIIIYFKEKKKSVYITKLKALVICCWISILAPFSWFIMAKGHSSHIHMNFILWYIPFIILGYALIGILIDIFIKNIINKFIYIKI